MEGRSAKSPATLCKIFILILGVVVLGVGLHSHFKSAWNHSETAGPITVKAWDMCKKVGDVQAFKGCPPMSIEKFYVSIIIITFILSLGILVATFMMDINSMKTIDMAYHGLAALLLLIAAICYIVSAEKIDKIKVAGTDVSVGFNTPQARKELLRSEKLAAGALSIIQTLLYGVTAFLLSRG